MENSILWDIFAAPGLQRLNDKIDRIVYEFCDGPLKDDSYEAMCQMIDGWGLIADSKQLSRTFQLLTKAMKQKKLNVLRAFADKGVCSLLDGKLGGVLVMLAAEQNNVKALDIFLKAGAKGSVWRVKTGTTPLMAMAAHQNKMGVSLLLNYGANPMVRDKSGKQAIDYWCHSKVTPTRVAQKAVASPQQGARTHS